MVPQGRLTSRSAACGEDEKRAEEDESELPGSKGETHHCSSLKGRASVPGCLRTGRTPQGPINVTERPADGNVLQRWCVRNRSPHSSKATQIRTPPIYTSMRKRASWGRRKRTLLEWQSSINQLSRDSRAFRLTVAGGIQRLHDGQPVPKGAHVRRRQRVRSVMLSCREAFICGPVGV